MQWKEDTTAGSRMSMGHLAYGIRTTTKWLKMLKTKMGLYKEFYSMQQLFII